MLNLVKNLPPSITHLTFLSGDDIHEGFFQNVDDLPASITHLTFSDSFNLPVDHLPASITHLTVGASFRQPLGNLPSSLTHLTFEYFGEFENQESLDLRILPPCITHLRINRCVNEDSPPFSYLSGPMLKELTMKWPECVEVLKIDFDNRKVMFIED